MELRRKYDGIASPYRYVACGTIIGFAGALRGLARRGARSGVLFHNPAALVRLLARTNAPLTWFAGHVHRHGAVSMERRHGALRDLPEARADSGDDCVNFVQAPSLGLQGTREQDEPGYVLAAPRNGRLTEYGYRSVEARPSA